MQGNRFYLLVILTLLALLGYLAYGIVRPFLNVIAWSVVLSIVFYPVYAFVLGRFRIESLAAGITILIMIVVIVGPVAYVAIMLVSELQSVASLLDAGGLDPLKSVIERLRTSVLVSRYSAYLGIGDLLSDAALLDNIKRLGKGLIEQLSSGLTNVLAVLIDFIFTIFTTFFLLKDGTEFLTKAKTYLPFGDAQRNRLAVQVKDMVVTTVYGGVAIALIQGLLGGIAYFVIGLESPVLWGAAMSVMSFVPLLGTFAVWGPTALYLIVQGDFVHGIGLLLYGVFVISMVDNILKPLIIGSRTKMPTIVILFSVLGGIKFFGMIGLVMGPLIIAVFISVFELFMTIEGAASETS